MCSSASLITGEKGVGNATRFLSRRGPPGLLQPYNMRIILMLGSQIHFQQRMTVFVWFVAMKIVDCESGPCRSPMSTRIQSPPRKREIRARVPCLPMPLLKGHKWNVRFPTVIVTFETIVCGYGNIVHRNSGFIRHTLRHDGHFHVPLACARRCHKFICDISWNMQLAHIRMSCV